MHNLDDLIYLMQRLRDPEKGCPWDIKQVFTSITSSTIEEAYELVDAIEQGDMAQIKEELGDVLFQVMFYAQMGDEQGDFNFHQIVDVLTAKLIRRHPHVFPQGNLREQIKSELDEAAVKEQWEAIKQQERDKKALGGRFDDIPNALPAITRAQKILKRLPNPESYMGDDAIGGMQNMLEQLRRGNMQAEETEKLLGEFLFESVKLAKSVNVDAEKALRRVNSEIISTYNHTD